MLCLVVGTAPTWAAETLRIGLQTTGTFAWQLDVIRRHGLADSAGLDLKISEFASPDAGKLAINSGSVDVAVVDWLWVARARALGAKLLFYPYSSAVGAIMVKGDSAVRKIGDLKGRVLAVAGGPLDKSWLIVQVAAIRAGIDLKRETTLEYGAPPLIAQKLQQGEADASLNFWNFCARLEALGYRRLLDVRDAEAALGLKQPVALIGYVFSEQFVASHRRTIDRFIAVTQKANDIMLRSDQEWDALRPLMNAEDEADVQGLSRPDPGGHAAAADQRRKKPTPARCSARSLRSAAPTCWVPRRSLMPAFIINLPRAETERCRGFFRWPR